MSVVFRYRRAGDVKRRQPRWVSFAFAVVCLMVGISLTPPAQAVFSSAVAQALLVVVVALQQVLAPLTGRSELAVAGATMALAVVFGPARARLQSAVDRLFNRARCDAQHTVDAVRLRLRNEVALDHVGAVLVAAVHPVAVSLWLSDTTGARATASHPSRGERRRRPVTGAGGT